MKKFDLNIKLMFKALEDAQNDYKTTKSKWSKEKSILNRSNVDFDEKTLTMKEATVLVGKVFAKKGN